MINLAYDLNKTVDSTGTEITNSGKILTDFIPVYKDVFNILYLDNDLLSSKGVGIKKYDADKNYIDSTNFSGKLVTTPINASYIKCVINATEEEAQNVRFVVNGLELCLNNSSSKTPTKGDILYKAGYLNDSGTLVTNATNFTTESYFSVEPSTMINLTYNSSLSPSAITMMRINEFDESKNFVKRQYKSSDLDSPVFTLGDSTKYIQIGITISNNTTTPLYDLFNSFVVS